MTFSGFSLPVSVSQADILPPSTVYKTRIFASKASSSTALGIWYCRISLSSTRSHILISLSRPEVKRNSPEATIVIMDFWCPTRACVHLSPTVLSFTSGECEGRNFPVADLSTLTCESNFSLCKNTLKVYLTAGTSWKDGAKSWAQFRRRWSVLRAHSLIAADRWCRRRSSICRFIACLYTWSKTKRGRQRSRSSFLFRSCPRSW